MHLGYTSRKLLITATEGKCTISQFSSATIPGLSPGLTVRVEGQATAGGDQRQRYSRGREEIFRREWVDGVGVLPRSSVGQNFSSTAYSRFGNTGKAVTRYSSCFKCNKSHGFWLYLESLCLSMNFNLKGGVQSNH